MKKGDILIILYLSFGLILASCGSGGGGTSGGGSPISSNSTTRISVSSSGIQSNSDSVVPSISSNGRFVAFNSFATNLVAGDTNGVSDIFVHDRKTGTTTRVSVDSSGTQGNDTSSAPSISSDGRYVAFESASTNLVPGDTNGVKDIFVYDRNTATTTRVSVDLSGIEGDGISSAPSISSDGRYVAFRSAATNLVSDDTNAVDDIFVHDRNTGTTTRVSVTSGGIQGNDYSLALSINSDGRYVAFESSANNLVSDDTNGVDDIFVHDRNTGTTTRVSISSGGIQGNGFSVTPSISPDGRYVAFESSANNLVSDDTNGVDDIFVHDRNTGTTIRVSVSTGGIQGNNGCILPSISSDGRNVAFESVATNLVSGDTNGTSDIFVHDLKTGTTTRVSVSSGGIQGNSFSSALAISSNGNYVAFRSEASNLVADDTNGVGDIFVNGP